MLEFVGATALLNRKKSCESLADSVRVQVDNKQESPCLFPYHHLNVEQ
jgi:hypothetical protein